MPKAVKAEPLIRNAAIFGCIGLASGILVWLVISFVWDPVIRLDTNVDLAGWNISFGHITLAPGFIFGNSIGLALVRFGLAGAERAVGYIAAAVVSNFIATNFAGNMFEAFSSAAMLGVTAGLVGAACLTGLTLLLFPFARNWHCLWMLAAGTALGALLHVAIEDASSWGRGFLILYACWQAGYGAALGLVVPPRSAG